MKNLLLSFASRVARLMPMSFRQALYRLGPLSRLLRGVLNRAAPSGLTRVVVAAGGLQGVSLMLDLQREKDCWLGTFEPELQRAIADFVQPGQVAYDVGANIGYISLLLARAVGAEGKAYSFEALPANQERLRTNLDLNPHFSTVEIIPNAVADQTVPLQFLVHASGGMGKIEGSAGRQETYQESITVPGISLDDFVYSQGHPPPNVVKMDIEGGEVLALPGMARLLAEARPLLFLELHGPEAARLVWETLSAASYQICRMTSGYPLIPSLEALDWKSYLVARPPR